MIRSHTQTTTDHRSINGYCETKNRSVEQNESIKKTDQEDEQVKSKQKRNEYFPNQRCSDTT